MKGQFSDRQCYEWGSVSYLDIANQWLFIGIQIYFNREFEENPGKIWESNIFGTSLYGLVNEGLHNKLLRMPMDARLKLKETVERIINEGCSGLLCIIV